MKPLRSPRALVLLAIGQFACTTVYRPPEQPVTEGALAAAIETIHVSGAPVEMLEDGLQMEVYRYEWRGLPNPPEIQLNRDLFYEPLVRHRQQVRMLAGPRESVYLPYSWIHSVEARSWPLWAGVEILLTDASEVGVGGPLVIRAVDAEEAARLTDAIDCLRRARRLPNASPPEGSVSSFE